MNAMSETRLRQVYPPLAAAVRTMHQRLLDRDIVIRVTSGYRSFQEQQKLYEQRPRVTRAGPGFSMHNFGLAVDLAPGIIGEYPWKPDWNDTSPAWQVMLALGLELGLECGGAWKLFRDLPHFQWGTIPVTPTEEMRIDYRQGGCELVWEYLERGKYPRASEILRRT
jgi:peptidoglycan LD-endopeptidase CwlK